MKRFAIRRKKSWRKAMKVLSVIALGAISLSGCTADYVTGSQGDVLLFINSINDGRSLDSDVAVGEAAVSDRVPVSLALRVKNPSNTVTPQVALAVRVERYEVRYVRSDGRGVEGSDVPFPISGDTAFTLDVGGNGDMQLEVVRAQAKLEPPLRNLKNNGGQLIFTVFADVTVYGRTTSGAAVSATGRLQINFSDFPN